MDCRTELAPHHRFRPPRAVWTVDRNSPSWPRLRPCPSPSPRRHPADRGAKVDHTRLDTLLHEEPAMAGGTLAGRRLITADTRPRRPRAHDPRAGLRLAGSTAKPGVGRRRSHLTRTGAHQQHRRQLGPLHRRAGRRRPAARRPPRPALRFGLTTTLRLCPGGLEPQRSDSYSGARWLGTPTAPSCRTNAEGLTCAVVGARRSLSPAWHPAP
jgi:hypothetical protein